VDVKELIDELLKLPSDCEVIIQKDAEGNGYSPLSGVDGNCFYFADDTWAGDVFSGEWTADECCMSEEDWKKMHGGPKVVVLHPIN